ncbi:type I polyketide synthase [Corynebacterium tapiri]|uniref:DUF1729 domain-containing protein n=1 Tax=Corynebacterium tapiri TaxID=1448266 RepID=A0A5C4U3H7_9CORY|nr:type I polyketide synthase [Corynebacterium tapiri]TNL97316.1 DUF1729 domain-containing protein [Corynebacterium tapiri]
MSLTPLSELTGNHPPAILFAGQASAWQKALADASSTPHSAARLRDLLRSARARLAPLARELTATLPGAADRLAELIGAEATKVTNQPLDVHPAVSIPGITLGQIAATDHLREIGLPVDSCELIAHSQGRLGVAAVAEPETALAFALLLGAAANQVHGSADSDSHLLSVQGINREALHEIIAGTGAEVAVVNGPRHVTLSGTPAELAAAQRALETAAERSNDEISAARRGGAGVDLRCTRLAVAYPFHHSTNQAAADLAVRWADECGLSFSGTSAHELAEQILVEPDEFASRPIAARYVLSLDEGVGRIVEKLVEGRGTAVINAATAAARDLLATPGATLPEPLDYSSFAPRLVTLDDGRTYTQTRFSELTGLSPILLGGMTPTTADAGIVAAAANAGYWTELAGGGMYSDEVFNEQVVRLEESLQPGRTAQFNTMFMDRFLWNLHFGPAGIVPKARAAGAPFSGVVISAGIPEIDEAGELIQRLHKEGFTYVAFKPGTPSQIRDVVAIAQEYPDVDLVMMVEDGHAGGHHSWTDLDEMLLETYAEIRRSPNLVLTVGGGVHAPERASALLTGEWSKRYQVPPMPVDGVFVGTVAMACREAQATDSVKQLLVDTPGIDYQTNGGWVARGTGSGGAASSQSHLLADIHEVDNSFARASRLITSLSLEEYAQRRDEIIEHLNHTCKPYFGDVEAMTYAEWINRFVELAHPFVDSSWDDRFLDLLHRIEARLNPADHGEIETLFPVTPADPVAATRQLLEAYPSAQTTTVSPRDAAWWIALHYKHPKPMPWVPAIDGDLATWFGKDTLWQAQDERYTADQVRIIPGPVAVAGIARQDEPIAELLARFEQAATQRLSELGVQPESVFARLHSARSAEEYLRSAPYLVWHGHLIDNPAHTMAPEVCEVVHDEDGWALRVHTDSAWDELDPAERPFYVHSVSIPVQLPAGAATGAHPVVSDDRLPRAVFDLLSGLAGVGSTSASGDRIDKLPALEPSDESPYGVVHDSFTFTPDLLQAHTAVTGAALGSVRPGTPDVLVGPCWPAIYTALGSGRLSDGFPVIEGLLNAVHLNHVIDLRKDLSELADGRTIDVTSRCTAIEESASGRIVTVELELFDAGEIVATQMQRFAIRGRAHGSSAPSPAPEWGGGKSSTKVVSTPRSFLERATVHAPADMTPFALVSGDYNPIHTSAHAAQLVGLEDALVHGMWLSATAQHLAGRHGCVVGWTYSMYGMVQLRDAVEITVERVGRKGIHPALEVTCRIDGEVVSVGQALLAQPRTAYVYPGQGIQTEGMGAADRAASPAAREVFARADAHTRTQHGFSIQHIIDDNPVELSVRGTLFTHPQGVLHLTQFTQVALAVVAYAQTERLREANALGSNALYAGHSLGEYTALASQANIFDLESVIDVVYSRGTAMGSLVERDEQGNSNYAMAALRPNLIAVSDAQVTDYVAEIAQRTGEFLEIVNYNIAGQQYSVAGTKAGLAALTQQATAVHPRAVVTVPGIDVPFHSSVLRPGVADFAEKLDALLPAQLDLDALVGRYIPNLVARPFALDDDFIDAVRAAAPSQRLAGKKVADFASEHELARVLMIELLSWQFASPVRWIETQDVLFDSAEQIIEVGLASSPTLSTMAQRSLKILGKDMPVLNVERDQEQVMLSDVASAPVEEEADTPVPAAVEESPEEPVKPVEVSVDKRHTAAPELSFRAADAIMNLCAYSNKLRLEQISDTDTVEELTNGVSSRRNQLLMDMSAELGVPAIDGAAEATMTQLRERVDASVAGYSPFGPVLSEALTSRLRTLLGASGVKSSAIGERVTSTWGLPGSWVPHVECEILLGTREGDSVRGGQLATLPTSASNKAEAHALIDAAVNALASRHGVAVSLDNASAQPGAAMVDSAALNAFADSVTGPDGVLAATARTVLEHLGLQPEPAPAAETDSQAAVLSTIEAELGSGWLDMVSPAFDERQAVLFDDRFAYAREDLARVALGEITLPAHRFAGDGAVVANQARWWADNGGADPQLLGAIADQAQSSPKREFAEDIALVTGAAPGSIAEALVAGLLAEGATVIMTASRISQQRKEFARQLFAEHGVAGSALWLVPANLSSFRDVDSLIAWISTEQVETVGSEVKVLKPALVPTLAFPFAAPGVSGSVADAGPQTENQARLLLWSVERTIAGLAEVAARSADTRTHIVLPGSPNRGMFGGDGAYAEVKNALDAILAKWSSESGWPEAVTLAQAKIGWVAGTHLMAGNDVLVPAAQEAGIRVWTPDEISAHLLQLATPQARERACERPLEADLTGGLGEREFSIAELAHAAAASPSAEEPRATTHVRALPNTPNPHQVAGVEVGEVTRSLEDMVVVVGIGEASSWGSGRTRFEAEYGIQRDGTVDLTAAGVLELAWMTGLVRWSEDPTPGWYDASGELVAEEDIYDRFRDEVLARSGIRELSDKYHLVDQGSIDLTTVFLDRDITFPVDSEAQARDIAAADPDMTRIAQVDGEWQVTRLKGATAHVPRKATLSRTVAGQMPEGFDPGAWGIPEHMVDSLDRMAVWNLVTAVDAFINAGFSPAELLQAVHPLDVATTQGTGIGGMESLHKVFVSRFLGEDRPSDILQEALPNVVAAHTMQSLVGGYGSMIHPIGACATAAVSIEEAADKIALGKADFVVAGGIDDVQVESLTGFGDMNATAQTQAMRNKGIADRFISRANDRRRGGFLEAEGGGTVLLARASVAADLGLPVHAVLVHAASYGDGAHTSIPAPGIGVLGAARGGENSRLARSLRSLGLSPNDVRVLSKHDTSTNANDPNEAELHSLLWPAIGRDPDAPMFVISQKSLTGHAKAGAALFQTGGLIDALRTGKLPANASLDTVDPLIEPKATSLVWLRSPLHLGEVKAAALTSLGFGHVGALVVYAHPGVFEAALRAAGRSVEQWRKRATERLRRGAARLQAGMLGRAPLFVPIEGRRLPADNAHEAEIAMLLDASARLSADGHY